MKQVLTLFLILSLALATSITVPAELDVSDQTQIGIHLQGASVGKLLTASWSNEKVHVFPGQFIIESPNQQFT